MRTKELYTIVHYVGTEKRRLTLPYFTKYEYASSYATGQCLRFWHIEHPSYERELLCT